MTTKFATTEKELSEKQGIADRAFDYLEGISSQIGDILTELGAKLGVATEHVYTTLVKQQVALGVIEFVETFIWLVVLLVAYKFLVPTIKNNYKLYNELTDISITFGIILMVLATCFVVSAFDLPEAIAKFVNPEYYAMKEIMEFMTEFMKK